MGNQIPASPGSWQSVKAPDPSKVAVQAEKVAGELAGSAIERVQDVRSKAESGLVQQRGQLTQRIRRVGDALRATGDDLRSEDDIIAGYMGQAGDQVDRIAGYVSTVKLAEVSRDVQRFARERPAWFFGGTFLLGLAAGRFLKSSAASEQSGAPAQSGPKAQSGAPEQSELPFSAVTEVRPMGSSGAAPGSRTP